MSLRPGGFPEYGPGEQIIFDQILKTIEKNYQQFGYTHICTPAVERNDVLNKGGDEISKQIFGLYGLAQGGEDLKEYSLHFDLTVPFARYVLDRQEELAFPFRRYQIQPVWRGERSQKGRFKEFWQADIDIIRKENKDTDKDIITVPAVLETIQPIAKTLDELFSEFKLKNTLTIHINNKKILAGLFSAVFGSDEEKIRKMYSAFDKYYKMTPSEFDSLLQEICSNEEYKKMTQVLKNSKDIKKFSTAVSSLHPDASVLGELANLESVLHLSSQLSYKQITVQFDPFIVRGLDYYTGYVFETFINDKMEIGSICSGGEYKNFTRFIDPKNIFSGIGISIGVSRLAFILTEELGVKENFKNADEHYLFVNFPETLDETFALSLDYIKEGKIVEIYPIAKDLAKQFQYADKKGIPYVVILGKEELTSKKYKIKNMKTGEEKIVALK